MRRFRSCLTLGLLIAAGAANAENWSLNSFRSHVLPVLVQVDSMGKVTNVSPALELTPLFDRLLKESLDEMITGPALHHGKQTASQFVINLKLKTAPKEDGNYDVRFAYVSAVPVPGGNWHWSLEDGHRLALVSNHRGTWHYNARAFATPPTHNPFPPAHMQNDSAPARSTPTQSAPPPSSASSQATHAGK